MEPYLRYLKGLCFAVDRESDFPGESFERFLERAGEEYGLAAACHDLSNGDYSAIKWNYPSLVLDLSADVRSFRLKTAPGTIWLDMDSLEEKRRKLERQGSGITYFSIKKEWIEKNRK